MTEKEFTGRPEMFGTLLASKPRRSTTHAARSTAGALVLHAGLIVGLLWATMAVGTEAFSEEEITFIEIPPEPPPLPPPPPPPPPVARPVVEPPAVVPRGFQTLTMPDVVLPDIPPPSLGEMIREEDFSGLGVEGGRADGDEKAPPPEDPSLAPVFTPFTIRPELRNPNEVARALERNYPPVLRDAGIGGTSVMWFFIDETGKVLKTQLFESSGYDALDQAAAKVAGIMEFSPARNRDRLVQVWVQIPITFQSR